MPKIRTLLIGLLTLGVSALLAGCSGVVKPAEIEVVNRGQSPWRATLTAVNHRPLTIVECQGRKLTLMIDTGGGDGFALRKSAITGLTFEKTGMVSFADATGRVTKVPQVRLLDFRIGGLHLDSVTGHIVDDADADRDLTGLGAGVDGWVGWGLLRQFNVFFDFPAGTMELMPHDQWPSLKFAGVEVPYAETRNGIELEAEVDGEGLTMLLDTGSSATVKRVASVSGDQPFDQTGISSLRVGGVELLAAGMDAASRRLILLPFKQPSVDGFLGMNLLANYRLLILPAKQVVVFGER